MPLELFAGECLQVSKKILKSVMPISKQTKSKSKSEADLLDQATSGLLKAVKAKAARSGKPLRKSELLKQGYSERFVAKVEGA